MALAALKLDDTTFVERTFQARHALTRRTMWRGVGDSAGFDHLQARASGFDTSDPAIFELRFARAKAVADYVAAVLEYHSA